MRYQPWKHSDNWELTEPKLIEVREQRLNLKHTQNLVNQIDLEPAGILVVRGPRQVGKSTFLLEFAKKTLKNGMTPENLVLYHGERFKDRFSFETEVESFIKESNGYLVIMADELTVIENWWLAVKSLADRGLFTKVLFICTGSSSEDISEGMDLMPGRRGRRSPVDFTLLPVRYKDVAHVLTLEEFCLTGGWPWSINEYLKIGVIPEHVYQVYASWIQGAFYKKRYSHQNLPFILHGIINHLGTPISMQKFSRDTGLSTNLVGEQYINILQKIFALYVAYWAEPGRGIPFPRKNRKMYPADPFLFHLFADFGLGFEDSYQIAKTRLADPMIMGAIAENLVASDLLHRGHEQGFQYWLGRKEIDFILPDFVEVKYQKHVSVNEFEWLNKIIPANKNIVILTQTDKASNDRIHLIPLREWLCR